MATITLSKLNILATSHGVPEGKSAATKIATTLRSEFPDCYEDPSTPVMSAHIETVRGKYFALAKSPEDKGALKLLDFLLARLNGQGTETATASAQPDLPRQNCTGTGLAEEVLAALRKQAQAEQAAGVSLGRVSLRPKQLAFEGEPAAVLLDWKSKRMQVLEQPVIPESDAPTDSWDPNRESLENVSRRLYTYSLAFDGEPCDVRELAPAVQVEPTPDGRSFSLLNSDMKLRLLDQEACESQAADLTDFDVSSLAGTEDQWAGYLKRCIPNPCGPGLLLVHDYYLEFRDLTGKLLIGPIDTDFSPAVGFSKAKGLMAVGSNNPNIRIFDAGTGQELPRLETVHMGQVTRLAFTPAGDLLVTGADRELYGESDRNCKELRVHDLATGKEAWAVSPEEKPRVRDWHLSPEGELILLRDNGTLEARNPRTGELIAQRSLPPAPELGTDYKDCRLWVSPDARCIAVTRPAAKRIYVFTDRAS